MSLGLYEDRRRARRRRWLRLGRFALLALAFAATAVIAYRSGIAREAERSAVLKTAHAALRARAETLARENAALAAAQAKHEAAIAQWEARYARDVPQGDVRELVALIHQKLERGVAASRLAFVVGMAENERVCDAPETKRFIVQTPLTTGGNDAVSFADQRLTVSAEGQTTRDAAGNPLAAFDPAQPVTVHFTMLGGESRQASGTLPLHHALVLNENEYRFTLRPGAQGFATITAERCDYP